MAKDKKETKEVGNKDPLPDAEQNAAAVWPLGGQGNQVQPMCMENVAEDGIWEDRLARISRITSFEICHIEYCDSINVRNKIADLIRLVDVQLSALYDGESVHGIVKNSTVDGQDEDLHSLTMSQTHRDLLEVGAHLRMAENKLGLSEIPLTVAIRADYEAERDSPEPKEVIDDTDDDWILVDNSTNKTNVGSVHALEGNRSN